MNREETLKEIERGNFFTGEEREKIQPTQTCDTKTQRGYQFRFLRLELMRFFERNYRFRHIDFFFASEQFVTDIDQ